MHQQPNFARHALCYDLCRGVIEACLTMLLTVNNTGATLSAACQPDLGVYTAGAALCVCQCWKHRRSTLLSTSSGAYACWSSPAAHAITHQKTANKQHRAPAAATFRSM